MRLLYCVALKQERNYEIGEGNIENVGQIIYLSYSPEDVLLHFTHTLRKRFPSHLNISKVNCSYPL